MTRETEFLVTVSYVVKKSFTFHADSTEEAEARALRRARLEGLEFPRVVYPMVKVTTEKEDVG